jgi:hypothetical protein
MTIETTTVPDAIDYLLNMIAALPECAPPVAVLDGFPGEISGLDTIVTVGGEMNPTATGTMSWAALGGPVPARDERYTIDVGVWCWVGGSNNVDDLESLSDAQKTARDNAFTIVRAIEKAVRNDPTFGGLFGTGWSSVLDTFHVDQTNADTDPTQGRVCDVHFDVGVYSRRRTF